MIRRKCTIINRLGLHARAAAKLVTLASRFNCTVELEYEQKIVNGKSIMGVMMLAASKGTIITLIADGTDETEAIEAVIKLINDKFGENT